MISEVTKSTYLMEKGIYFVTSEDEIQDLAYMVDLHLTLLDYRGILFTKINSYV